MVLADLISFKYLAPALNLRRRPHPNRYRIRQSRKPLRRRRIFVVELETGHLGDDGYRSHRDASVATAALGVGAVVVEPDGAGPRAVGLEEAGEEAFEEGPDRWDRAADDGDMYFDAGPQRDIDDFVWSGG